MNANDPPARGGRNALGGSNRSASASSFGRPSYERDAEFSKRFSVEPRGKRKSLSGAFKSPDLAEAGKVGANQENELRDNLYLIEQWPAAAMKNVILPFGSRRTWWDLFALTFVI